MKTFDKQISTAFSKGLGKGVEITPEQMDKIRKFTLADIPAEQLYVRKMLLAHNAIDRDEERFSETLLGDFVKTMPGKSFLIAHQWGPPGKGIFFDAQIEEMDLAEARKMTGEDLKLPDGVSKFQAFFAWVYTTKTAGKEELLADIDAGINRHVSIGFQAANLVRISDEQTGETLYYEYKAPGEAREGSLVWLGAQPGATFTKSVKDGVDIEDEKNKSRRRKQMDKVLLKLGLQAGDTEDNAIKILNQRDARLKTLEETLSPLGENATKQSVQELVKAAEDGRVYKKDLISRQIKCERLLGRMGDKPEEETAREKQLMARDLSDIKGDITFLEKQVGEKFPGKSAIEGGDPNGNRGATDPERAKTVSAIASASPKKD